MIQKKYRLFGSLLTNLYKEERFAFSYCTLVTALAKYVFLFLNPRKRLTKGIQQVKWI